MKDYILQIKIKNGFLLRLMREHGCPTAPALQRASGVSLARIYQYLNLKDLPIRKDGAWQAAALQLSEFFRVLPEMLFPVQHITKALPTNSIEAEISLDEIKSLPGLGGSYLLEDGEEEEEESRKLQKYLDTLPSREQSILTRRFGLNGGEPMLLEELSKDFGVTRNRIMQIEKKAIIRMRHRYRGGDKEEI